MTDEIRIADAYENNLKHVSLTIPKGKLVVFAGVSGSGKSSLAFDTIAVESSRQWQSNYPLFLRNKMPHYERPKVESIENLTPSIVEVLQCTDEEIVHAGLSLADGSMGYDELLAWIREHAMPQEK